MKYSVSNMGHRSISACRNTGKPKFYTKDIYVQFSAYIYVYFYEFEY